VRTLVGGPGVILVCGRFEGVDERVIAARALEEVSIGDYVLSGGELAAMVLIDACVRLLPGVMGATAAYHLLRRYDALEGQTFVILGSGAEATVLAEALRSAGRTVAAIP